MKSETRRSLLAVGMILFVAGMVWGQATSSLSGRLTDQSGAAVPSVKVAVRNIETGATRTTSSDETGFYRVLSLPVGHYEVRGEKEGFKSQVRSGIELAVGQEAVINLSLEIGDLVQEVTVSEAAPLVNTTTAETSGLVGERAVKELPLNGRSYDNLITLNAGTVNFSSMHTTSSSYTGGLGNRFSVSGRRPDANLFLLNGVEYGGNGSIATTPGSVSKQLLGIDAIREFNVVRDNYSAEYGKRAGGQISIVTMSGTNQFHGSLFEFLRNSVLDARNFFDPFGVPPFKRNNFGGSAGGPIWKDKTFVFGNYEGLRQRLGLSNVAIVPDQNARRGFISNAPGQFVNVGLAPGVAPYLDFWPLPNGPIFVGGVGLYYNNASQSIREEFGTVRIDHIHSEKDSINAVFTIDDGESRTPLDVGTFQTELLARTQIASLSHVHIFSPSMLNSFTLGFSRAAFDSGDIPLISIPANLSFTEGNLVGRIRVATTGGTGGGDISQAGNTSATGGMRNLFTYTDTVQITRGAHLIGTGVWFVRLQENEHKGLDIGQVTFTNLTDMLQGRMQLLTAAPFPKPLGLRSLQGAWFVQDTIKFRSNLTLSVGVRHEFTNGWNEVSGRLSMFEVGGPTAALLDQPRIGTSGFKENKAKWLFGPRVGLAWDPFGNGRTAIRAGIGMYYSLLDDLAFWSIGNPPFTQRIQVANAPFPFPQITPANILSLPGVVLAPRSLQQDMKTPTLIGYNFKIEQELMRNLAVTFGYTAFHGYHDYGTKDFNTALPLICSTAARNCPVGLADGSKYFPANVQRRNPRMGSTRVISDYGATWHNSMSVELTRRFAQGLTLRSNYTWGKTFDIVTSAAALGNSSSGTLDSENWRVDRGLSNYDVRHRFTASGSYELPIGSGKAFGSNLGGIADRILGGWQLNAILNLQTGLPFTPVLGFNNSRSGNTQNPDRPSPNQNFSGELYPRTIDRWFDVAAYTLPLAGTYGYSARNSLTGPNVRTVDMSLFKNISISENLRAQFRAEAFNLLNHANFGTPSFQTLNPNGTPRPTAGRITDTTTTSRQLQFGLRIIW